MCFMWFNGDVVELRCVHGVCVYVCFCVYVLVYVGCRSIQSVHRDIVVCGMCCDG